MHQWFVSRGEAEPHATYAAAIGGSVLLSMNITSITLFAHALLGVKWYRILGNVPLHLFFLALMVMAHSWLLRRLQKQDQMDNCHAISSRNSFLPAWLVYLVSSIVLLIVGVVLVSR
jgi:hypothetical protein